MSKETSAGQEIVYANRKSKLTTKGVPRGKSRRSGVIWVRALPRVAGSSASH